MNKNLNVFLEYKCDSSSNSVDENNCPTTSNLRKMTSVNNLNTEEEDLEDLDFSGMAADEDDDSVQEIDEIMFGFVNSDDYQLSSPSSLNSDDCIYAYRGRIDIMPQNNHENLNYPNGIGPLQNDNRIQNENDNEETDDFLEMDFDPETNSEIENDPQSDNPAPIHHPSIHLHTNGNHMNDQHIFENIDKYNGASTSSSNHLINNSMLNGHQAMDDSQKTVKNTGTKPKIPSASSSINKSVKSTTKHISSQDKLHLNNNYYCSSSSSSYAAGTHCLDNDPSSLTFNLNNNNVNNHTLINNRHVTNHNNNTLGYLSNGSNNNLLLNDNQFCNLSMENQLNNNHFKYHHNYNYLEHNHHYLHNNPEHYEKQQQQHNHNDFDLLLDIEPHKPRNSVTIYTTNCDEKILIDALTSLNLEPNRELISSYFNNLIAHSSANELNLINYIINKSKLNCNYKGLIDLIEKSCKNIDDDNYGAKKFDINFYTLDLFSNQPEMIEVNVNDITKRWTPNTNLRQLVAIKNKYFQQTNVLGKIVNIIRKINQEPKFKFKDTDTIKIPQFYKSGYITITLLK